MVTEYGLGKLNEFFNIYSQLNAKGLFFILDNNYKITHISDSLAILAQKNPVWFIGKSFDSLQISLNLENNMLLSTQESEMKINGGKLAFLTDIIPVPDENGNTLAFLVELKNITEYREKITQLTEINHSKDKLYSVIAHDLKGPLSTILGLTRFLMEQAEENADEEIYDIATSIYKLSENTYNLILNLLEWSRLQTGRISMNPVSIALKSFTKNILSLIEFQAISKNIKFEISFPKALNVFADENMLDSIMRNLISNAVKFSFPNGIIKIKAEKNENFFKISVIDHGTGIAEEDQKKLFKPGYIVCTPGTNDEKGSGIGLLLCHEFVKRHHGEIWFESEEGKGSMFHFTLPTSAKVFQLN